MADTLGFDRLNRIGTDQEEERKMRSMPYDRYFGEMDLSDDQKKKREETARDLEDKVLLYLLLMQQMIESGMIDINEIYEKFSSAYLDVIVSGSISNTDYFTATHIADAIASIINTTLKNPDDPFMFSLDRARLIAENESNFIWNDAEFQEAIEDGYTHKTWRAIIDKRTRETHSEVNGTKIPITEPFEVGDSLLMFPTDTSLGAAAGEIVNCRCSLKYTRETQSFSDQIISALRGLLG